jgi:hypothetical protein
MPFNELFGGQVLLPADLTYNALTISASIELVWPLEQQVGGTDVVADIIDLDAGNPGLNVDMPDARLVSPGTSVLFNNVGAQTVTVRDQAGGTIISLASGTTWMIYLRDNQTEAGAWRTFQFGASVSVANAAALAGAGLKAIGATLNTRIPVSPKNTNYTILDSDRAVALVWTSGVGQFDLPAAGTVGADWYCIIRNSGNGDLTVVPPSGSIDGSPSQTFPAGSSSFVVSDGVDYFTVGFGTGAGGGGGGFDFLVVNVAGSGDYTLAGAELNRVGYRFTGVLTGNRNIIVPNSTDEYWVDNQTTGAFSLFVKTALQTPGIEVLQNNRNILYCDGTNVVAAESATVSFPIPVAQGGTGATTASAARTNLGATVTGSALFTAVDAAAARTAISAVPTSRNVATQHSLTGGGDLSADRTLNLVNDTASPGNNLFYATGPTGTRGWLASTLLPQFASLGVGTAASGTTGEIRATNNVTAFYTSDIRLKENLRLIDRPLDKIEMIRGVHYDWTEDYIKAHGGEDGYFIRKSDVGLIAQEVEIVLPELVAMREDGYKGLKYERLVALLVEGIKELHARVQKLEG